MTRYLAAHPEISTVVLAGQWSFYVEGVDYKPVESSDIIMVGFFGEEPRIARHEQVVELGLGRTIQTLLGMNRNIVVVSPVPEIGYDVPSANFIVARGGRDLNEIIAPSVDDYFARNQRSLALLSRMQ